MRSKSSRWRNVRHQRYLTHARPVRRFDWLPELFPPPNSRHCNRDINAARTSLQVVVFAPTHKTWIQKMSRPLRALLPATERSNSASDAAASSKRKRRTDTIVACETCRKKKTKASQANAAPPEIVSPSLTELSVVQCPAANLPGLRLTRLRVRLRCGSDRDTRPGAEAQVRRAGGDSQRVRRVPPSASLPSRD